MKKSIFLSLFLLLAGMTVMAQGNSTKIEHLNYDSFCKKVWDMEKNPSKFVFKGKTPAIVDFYADWCGPCRQLGPLLDKLALEFKGKVDFFKINTDKHKEYFNLYEGKAIPLLVWIYFEDEEGVDYIKTEGYLDYDTLKDYVEQLIEFWENARIGGK